MAYKNKRTQKEGIVRVQFDHAKRAIDDFDRRFGCSNNNRRAEEMRMSMKVRTELDILREKGSVLIVRETDGFEYQLKILDRTMF